MYFLLILVLFAIWLWGFLISGRELLAPISLVPLSMLLGSILAAIGTRSWNTEPLGPECVLMVLLGTLAFVLGGSVHQLAFQRKSMRRTRLKLLLYKPAHGRGASVHKYWVMLAVLLVITCLHFYETMKLHGTDVTGGGLTGVIKDIRFATSSVFSVEGVGLEEGYPIYDRFLAKAGSAIGLVNAALLPYEFIIRRQKARTMMPSLILLVAYAGSTLLSGGRGGLVGIVVTIMVSLYVCFLWKWGGSAASKKTLLVVVGAGTGAVALFYLLGFLVGRPPSSGPVEYLSFYMGCGVPTLQKALVEGFPTYDLFGFNTLHEWYYFVSKFGLVSNVPAYGAFFLDLGGHSSNVLTFAYRYYADFGWAGLALLSGITGFLYSGLYGIVRRHANNPILLVLYARMGGQLFDMMRDEKFFAMFFTVNNLIIMALMVGVTLWLYHVPKPAVRRVCDAMEVECEPA